jgi:hypothetical protein
MLILLNESIDKKKRNYIDVEAELLLKIIENDYGLHEVINMLDSNIILRLFFDIELEDVDDYDIILENTLEILNKFYNTKNEDWAITCANLNNRASYHIYSKKYCIKLKKLREDVKKIAYPTIDDKVYYFSFNNPKDEASLRLPNQSKKGINKESGIHKIIQGELKDCLVTHFSNLIEYI